MRPAMSFIPVGISAYKKPDGTTGSSYGPVEIIDSKFGLIEVFDAQSVKFDHLVQSIMTAGLHELLAERQMCFELRLLRAHLALDPVIAVYINSFGGMEGAW